MEEYLAFWMFLAVFLVLLSGFPVAFALSGTALGFAALGIQLDLFDIAFLHALPNRLFGIINNETLIAVPLFVFMGVMLERAQLAEDLLESMADLFGSMRGGTRCRCYSCWYADGCKHRYCWRHGSNHGTVITTHHVTQPV